MFLPYNANPQRCRACGELRKGHICAAKKRQKRDTLMEPAALTSNQDNIDTRIGCASDSSEPDLSLFDHNIDLLSAANVLTDVLSDSVGLFDQTSSESADLLNTDKPINCDTDPTIFETLCHTTLSGLSSELKDTPYNNSKSIYDIWAFVVWENRMVQLMYPEEIDKWVERNDCGNFSQHRWSMHDSNGNETIQLVVKHNSCHKALSIKPLCRNCENRSTWRQPCQTPEHTFYLLAMNDNASYELGKYIKHTIMLSQTDINMYQSNKPSRVTVQKTPRTTETQRRMKRSKDMIRESVIAQNSV